MALNIKNSEADQLAHQLAVQTGETLTEAVITALRDRLALLQSQRAHAALSADVASIRQFVASLPDRDSRTADELLGYDKFGLPS